MPTYPTEKLKELRKSLADIANPYEEWREVENWLDEATGALREVGGAVEKLEKRLGGAWPHLPTGSLSEAQIEANRQHARKARDSALKYLDSLIKNPPRPTVLEVLQGGYKGLNAIVLLIIAILTFTLKPELKLCGGGDAQSSGSASDGGVVIPDGKVVIPGEGEKVAEAQFTPIADMFLPPPFDVAVCFSKSASFLPSANKDLVVGAIHAQTPQIIECLTDRGLRDEKEDRVRLSVQMGFVDGQSVPTVTGENTTSSNLRCVEEVVKNRVRFAALVSRQQGVVPEVSFVRKVGRNRSVSLGVSEVTDYLGVVRLSQPFWCECYQDFAREIPPTITFNVYLKQWEAEPKQISFERLRNKEEERLANCLKEKMLAVGLLLFTSEHRFSYRMSHLNSFATAPAPNLSPALRFHQLDRQSLQRIAEVDTAKGARDMAAEAYRKLGSKARGSAKASKLCEDLAASSRSLVAAHEELFYAEQAHFALTSELVKHDPSAWTAAESELKAQVELARVQLEQARARSVQDSACLDGR